MNVLSTCTQKGTEWGVKRWRHTFPEESRSKPNQRGGGSNQPGQGKANESRGAIRWRSSDPELYKALFRAYKRPLVRELLESGGNLKLYSIAPNGDCGWSLMSLALTPYHSWISVDLVDIYAETIRAHQAIINGDMDAIIGDPEAAKLMKELSSARVSLLTKGKKHPCGELIDIEVLTLCRRCRTVIYQWNSVEEIFTDTVNVIDWRDPSNPYVTNVRGSNFSTIQILYTWNGFGFEEGRNNHYDLLLPIGQRESALLSRHEERMTVSNQRGNCQREIFNPNIWLCAGLNRKQAVTEGE